MRSAMSMNECISRVEPLCSCDHVLQPQLNPAIPRELKCISVPVRKQTSVKKPEWDYVTKKKKKKKLCPIDQCPYLMRSQGCIWIRLLIFFVVVHTDFPDAFIEIAEYFVVSLLVFLLTNVICLGLVLEQEYLFVPCNPLFASYSDPLGVLLPIVLELLKILLQTRCLESESRKGKSLARSPKNTVCQHCLCLWLHSRYQLALHLGEGLVKVGG